MKLILFAISSLLISKVLTQQYLTKNDTPNDSITKQQIQKINLVTNNSNITGSSLICMILGFVICFIIFVFIVYWCIRKIQDYKVQKLFFLEQKRRRNIVNSNGISQQQFQIQRKKFTCEKWTISLIHNNKLYKNSNYTLSMKKQSNFLFSLKMKGQDDLGKWTAKGYYLFGNQGIQFWIVKNYQQKFRKTKKIYWRRLFFEGTLTQPAKYNGNWYIKINEQMNLASGSLQMKLENDQIMNQTSCFQIV